MKYLLLFSLLVLLLAGCKQASPEKTPIMGAFEPLPFGSIQPTGWLKTQMEADLDGFVGHLDDLVPDLIHDPIYGAGRLHAHSEAKDLGNLKSGDAEGDYQYKWWNSETQSNWWDGYIRNVLLVGDSAQKDKVDRYITAILKTQDADGYLGIYSPELRYHFQAENGELWSKATLYRGLLAYYEGTNDPKVWKALVRAVDNVMTNYPVNASEPFFAGDGFTGGVSHGLTFTDVLHSMYQLSGDRKYLDYAVFFYQNFSKNHASEADAQLANILDPAYRLKAHGVHTYEHLRPLALAAYGSDDSTLQRALDIYLGRIARATTPAGGPIGDEWIGERDADATDVGYEYCSIHELMDSYATLLRLSGHAQYGDLMENIFYNAAQGARDPNHSCIAYLKTDNSYEMLGTKNGEAEPGRNQTRYKYSPVHQDVAVCCTPNAGKISPYFVQNAWMRQGDSTLVAALLLPNELHTTLGGKTIVIRTETDYPAGNRFVFHLSQVSPADFTLKIRKPAWATGIETSENWKEENGFVVIRRLFSSEDSIALAFSTVPRVVVSSKNEHYFFVGVQAYALPIASAESTGRTYLPGFSDRFYQPVKGVARFRYVANTPMILLGQTLRVQLENTASGKKEEVDLVPMGRTVLRQVGF